MGGLLRLGFSIVFRIGEDWKVWQKADSWEIPFYRKDFFFSHRTAAFSLRQKRGLSRRRKHFLSLFFCCCCCSVNTGASVAALRHLSTHKTAFWERILRKLISIGYIFGRKCLYTRCLSMSVRTVFEDILTESVSIRVYF